MFKAAWARGQAIGIHSWIYCLENAIITPLRDVIREPVPE
jgi:carbonic anhydrase